MDGLTKEENKEFQRILAKMNLAELSAAAIGMSSVIQKRIKLEAKGGVQK